MDKADLLLLASNEHLSVAELAAIRPELSRELTDQLAGPLTAAAAALFAGASPPLRAVTARLRTSRLREWDRPMGRMAVEALRAEIAADPDLAADPELAVEVDALDAAIPATGPTVREAAGLDLPVRANPALAGPLAAGRAFHLADAARLPDHVGRVLADLSAASGVTALDDATLAGAVERAELSADEARRAGDAVAVYRLLDERDGLMAAVADRLDDPRSLAGMDAAAWQAAVTGGDARPPGGLTPETYARVLGARVESVFPTSAVARRLRAAHPTPRRYPGLGLADVLADDTRPSADRDAELGRRVGLVHEFLDTNPDAVTVDLRVGSAEREALQFPAGADGPDRDRLVAVARSYQRAVRLADGDVATAEALVDAGYPSALALARLPRREAEEVVAGALAAAGRGEVASSAAAATVDRARRIATAAGSWSLAGLDALKGGFGKLAVANLSPDIADVLAEIPGYADLFGNQDYCDCGDCRSILSPAAYLVDLMRFVEENVTRRYFTGRDAHPLRLRNRRPDLWDRLELSCGNTTTELPYLEVVNEILEDAVARDAGHAGPSPTAWPSAAGSTARTCATEWTASSSPSISRSRSWECTCGPSTSRSATSRRPAGPPVPTAPAWSSASRPRTTGSSRPRTWTWRRSPAGTGSPWSPARPPCRWTSRPCCPAWESPGPSSAS